MRRHIATVAIASLLVACGRQAAPIAFVPVSDSNVAPFQADRETAWTQFRLGRGLNVVVTNPQVTDEPQWRRETRGAFSSSPSVAGSSIFFSDNKHKIWALDAASGSVVWSASTDNEMMSQPVYAAGSVYVGMGDSEAAIWSPPAYKLIGAGKSGLLAYDLKTGKPGWRFNLPGSGMPTPALIGTSIVHANGAGFVYGIDAATGAYRWHNYVGSDADMSQVVDGEDGRVYVAGSYPNAVYGLDARNGALRWLHGFDTYAGGNSDCPLASDADALYSMYVRQVAPIEMPFVPAGRPAVQHVYALSKKSGKLLWDRELPHVRGKVPNYNESAIPLLYAGTLYDGSGLAPVVSALDPATGAMRWQVQTNGPVKGGIAARDNVLYFGDLAGTLWAVDAKTGLPIGSIKTDTRFNVGSPIILNDSLIIGSADGTILAIPLRDIRKSQAVDGITSAPSNVGWLVLIGALALIAIAAGWLRVRSGRRRKHADHA